MKSDNEKIKLAYVTAIGIHKHGGTQKCGAWLLEDLRGQVDITLFTSRVEEFDTDGVSLQIVPTIYRPGLVRYFMFLTVSSLLLLLRKALGKDDFDIIHTTGADCLFANVITAHFCQAEWLRLVKEGLITFPRQTLRQKLIYLNYQAYYHAISLMEKIIYNRKNVKLIIAVSEGLKRNLVEHYGCSPESIVVIPNAVDERMLLSPEQKSAFRKEIREKHGLTEENIVLLFVAAGDWKRKGLLLLLKAMALLPQPEVKLLVVGGETNLGFYKNAAVEEGIEQRVIFTGPSSEVRKYYAAADMFVFPSFYDTFGLVVLEAMAARLPMIGTKVSGTEVLIQDGYNGFFVKHDPQDIAGKIKLLVEDEDLRRKMGENARRSASNYTRQEVARRTMEVYQKVLAQKRQERERWEKRSGLKALK